MADFDPKAERLSLDAMSRAVYLEIKDEGGNLAVGQLQDTINETWCRLTPQQKDLTAQVDESKLSSLSKQLPTSFLADGSGGYVGIQQWINSYVVPLHCKDK